MKNYKENKEKIKFKTKKKTTIKYKSCLIVYRFNA